MGELVNFAARAFALVSTVVFSLTILAQVPASAASERFAQCPDAGTHHSLRGTQCADIEVPLDHSAPDDGTIRLFVRKFPAQAPRKGQFWLVAGGPGESGASFYPFIETLRDAAPGFDLIVPDHRGTGFSTRLCPVEESAESEGGRALAAANREIHAQALAILSAY